MRFTYPACLCPDSTGELIVSFRDLPECLTSGADKTEALAEAADALEEAIAGRINRIDSIPIPSACRAGEHLVAVPAITAAKAALALALAESGLSRVARPATPRRRKGRAPDARPAPPHHHRPHRARPSRARSGPRRRDPRRLSAGPVSNSESSGPPLPPSPAQRSIASRARRFSDAGIRFHTELCPLESSAPNRAVKRTLVWVERNIVETRCRTRRPAAWRAPAVHAHAPRMAGPCLRRRPGARFHRCAAAPGTVEPETGAASARSFRPRAAMTLRTVSNVGLRSPKSAL